MFLFEHVRYISTSQTSSFFRYYSFLFQFFVQCGAQSINLFPNTISLASSLSHYPFKISFSSNVDLFFSHFCCFVAFLGFFFFQCLVVLFVVLWRTIGSEENTMNAFCCNCKQLFFTTKVKLINPEYYLLSSSKVLIVSKCSNSFL